MDDRDEDPTGTPPPMERPAGMPRWVKISLLVALALVVLFVVVNLAGGGEHGPGRHSGAGTTRAVGALA